ncbi:MAG TPA: hypothetical protein VKX28_16200 [Xanthobacteraceae bacterium]|nr:hypothetical protein [Xanthobacteraceae bacterium]
MTRPTVEVLGVYRVRATDALIQDRIQYSYSPDQVDTPEKRSAAEQESRELIESVALIEAMVRNPDERFNIGDFTQRLDGVAQDNWQAAYAEAFLSPDGKSLTDVEPSGSPGGDFRIAFFLHVWDAAKPLVTSYGDIKCPAVGEMPERLERLVPYENVS